MRRLVTWLLVTLGIAALVRKLRKRQEPEWTPAATPPSTPSAPAPSDAVSQGSESATAEEPSASTEAEPQIDPAAELREKLARSRADMPSSEATDETVEDRRASVHEQGRATLDEMQPAGEQAAETPAESGDEDQ